METQSGASSTTQNPKDLLGNKKVSISKLPAIAILHGAHAMMDGANKYGPYNWRDKEVYAHIYVDAALRHIQSWFEGEEEAKDSGVHHLGHAIACCAILLDAQECGKLVDNRPATSESKEVLSRVLERLSDKIKRMDRLYAPMAPAPMLDPVSRDYVLGTPKRSG